MVMLGIFLLIPSAIALQILRIQWVEGSNLRALWNAQAIDFVPIPAQRGQILDRNGKVLVSNTVRYKVAVDPLAPETTPADIDTLCQVLAKSLNRPLAEYRSKVANAPAGARYIVLAKNLGSRAYESISKLNFRGLILEETYKRRYNYDSLAAHALGFVNYNGIGMTGLEHSYQDVLAGKDGLQQVQRDRNNQIRAMVGAPRKRPQQGMSIQTTLDLQIQAIVEEELKKGIDLNLAKHGTAIVMDPRSGEVLAMANYPTFNPNAVGRKNENRRNFAISDMIEPGSTFKIVTAISAVEQNSVRFDEIFETPKDGKKLIYGQWMRDHDPLGNLTFPEVIQKSSNIATADLAMRIPKKVLYQYARNMGFASETHIDLPNEEAGRLRKPFEWSLVSQPWIAMGYEVQVTPIQLIQAYSAFANEGKMMRPYLVEAVYDERGALVNENRPTFVRQIADNSTIQKLLPVFEGVVADSGTASYAQLDGISVAGKTGTAQKYVDGRYQSKYRASFVGFFPSRMPKYVCLVLLEEPRRSIYGGFTCGPVFKNIAERIIGMDPKVQPLDDQEEPPAFAAIPQLIGKSREESLILLEKLELASVFEGNGDEVVAQHPEAGAVLAANQKVQLTLGSNIVDADDEDRLSVPDVRGMSVKNSIYLLNKLGLKTEVIGSGTVFAQYPKAGDWLRKGNSVTIRGRSKSLETLSKDPL